MTECSSCSTPSPMQSADVRVIECDPVFFHKVTIPAAMGDESQVPPTAGKYKNVLLQYAYNDHVYIYSSDGIPTFIRTGGSFNDLSNRPSYGNQVMTGSTNIPEVMDAEITITRNSSPVGSFSVNQGSDESININVPTKTSELTNDSNFPVDANYVHTDNNYSTPDKTKLTGMVEIDNIGANLTYNSTTKTLAADAQPAILYSSTGQNTDGAMTQKATTDELSGKATTAQLADVQSQIPTKTSELTNDSNFPVDANYVHTDNNFVNADKNAMQNMNRQIGYDLTVAADASTTTVTENKVNLYSGATSIDTLPLPVASASSAGVMNALTFQAVQSNSDNISAILDGAVALSGLPASPTQAELTSAWQAATGRTTVINRSQINDQTNSKLWTYYTNISQWTAASNTPTVVVNDATNTSKGIIQGSASGDGTIFVESDATMSVNGWDTLSAQVTANTSNLTGKADSVDLKTVAFTGSYGDLLNVPANLVQDASYVHTDNNFTTAEKTKLSGIAAGAEVNVQTDWNQTNSSADDYLKNRPSNIALIDQSHTTVSPTPWVNTSEIVDSAITSAKINNGAVTSQKIDWTTIAYTLYNSTSGSNGAIALSDSVANYDYFDIWFMANDGAHNSVRVFSPDVEFTMTVIKQYDAEGDMQRIKLGSGKLSGNQLIRYWYRQIDISGTTPATVNSYESNNIYVKKVIGYKTVSA